ncbi:ATP-binding protein [Kutzneria sp. NPDC052558]|uniref:ATP-binding protein n=1 Tax=Kutzneria sp. NPDC052558 TaxID=3364121 RepID=UPI0037CC45F8
MLIKPADVFGRETEWADLVEFTESELPGLRIAVVYGRRRQGKSYLLRRLADACGGLYHLATEQTETVNIRRFADSLADWLGLPAGNLSFADWEAALTTATGLMASRHHAGGPSLIVLDEFPYLINETPGLPSIVQAIYDRVGPGSTTNTVPLRLILCGSAISVMSELLSGTKALRGRGALELRVKPFGYRAARDYWGIDNPAAALVHNALVGGTPGYRDLVLNPTVPEDPTRIGHWLARNVLRPSAPLFDEANRVVHEDPRIRETAVYWSLMAAIAAGESSPTKIGGLLGRSANSLSHQLAMLESAGFVERIQDMLLDRRPVVRVADPLVRLHHLVVEPHLADLEAGHSEEVWTSVGHTVDSKIYGPHFEALATEWVTRYARAETGLDVGATGQATIACREHRTSHEIDILSLERGARPRTTGAAVTFIGEAKCRDRGPGVAQLHRLEHIRDLLTASGHDSSGAVLGLFSTTDFSDELRRVDERDGVLLVGLAELYGS